MLIIFTRRTYTTQGAVVIGCRAIFTVPAVTTMSRYKITMSQRLF